MVTERYLREKTKGKENHIYSYYPGYLFCQDTFYVGTIKSLGRIYQQAGIDAYAGFGFAKVYTDKMAISSIDFLKTKVLPIYRKFGIPLDRILTDNGKEYTTHWVNGNHEYETYLKQNHIRHTRIKPRTPQSNGMVERFTTRRVLPDNHDQKSIFLFYKMTWISLSLIIILKEPIRVKG